MTKALSLALGLPTLALLSGCNLAPAYHVPASAAAPAQFKADPGWQVAMPADDVAKGQWWKLFGDSVLDGLEARVAVTNQNVAQYRAAYEQARGLVKQDRAALFPSVSASAGATRGSTFAAGTPASSTFTGEVAASWSVDLWGKLGNTVRQAKAEAQASAADLANATLSAQGELAADYFALRGIDAQKAMLDETIAAYERSLTITKNKYAVGTASSADVDTAQSNLSTALASRRDLDRQRTAYEDAIAVLLGENPSAFRLAAAPWAPGLPEVPSVLPADVLQRRPDIASAERAVAAANANIGIQRAAFFPSLTLAPYAETSAGSMNQLFAASTSLWSLGASSALTLLDFGARSAQVKQARAAYDKAVAAYRLAALQAFQQVEDDLSALSAYRAEQAHYATAAAAANRAEAVARNEYAAGTVDYTTVTTAQATAYTARVSLINNTVNQQTAAVSLIEAIGGHWDTAAR